MGEMRNQHRIFVGKPEGRHHLGEREADRWTLQKQILKNSSMKVRTGFIWLRYGKVASSSERGNEPSCSFKEDKFLDQLRDYYLLKGSEVALRLIHPNIVLRHSSSTGMRN
jgi:hypothetical protein